MEIIILFLACMGFVVLNNAMEHGEDLALPSEHFDYIVPGSLISVKVHGQGFVEYGLIYEKYFKDWSPWGGYDFAKHPYGSDRVYLKITDPAWPKQRPKNDNYLAAELPLHIECNEDDRYPWSMLFVKTQNHIYYAILKPENPAYYKPLSTVSYLHLLPNNKYQRLRGALKPWDPNHSLPEWVREEKPPGL